MADPLLSTLCSICHAQPPKYKCPGCSIRTCSLPCIQKHKSRADCSGRRNPRAFVPVAQLRTQAGVDHDYNFLSSIERAKERFEKEIVDDRNLLNADILRPRDHDRHFNRVWHGDELRFVRRDDGDRYKPPRFGGNEKALRRRLRILDIELLEMPKGLQRYNDNKTAFNRRTLSINWQVEWVIYDRDGQATRIFRKMLDEMLLNDAAPEAIRWQQAQEERGRHEKDEGAESSAKKRRAILRKLKSDPAAISQDEAMATWPCTAYTFQSSVSSTWGHTTELATVPQTSQEQAAELALWQFFLAKAGVNGKEKALIPLPSPAVSLNAVLSGRTVLEFPTIYVLPPGQNLPGGFVLGSVERRVSKTNDPDPFNQDTEEVEESYERPAKRLRVGVNNRSKIGGKQPRREEVKRTRGKKSARANGEDGEINSDGQDVEMRNDGSVSSTTTLSSVSSDTSSSDAEGDDIQKLPTDEFSNSPAEKPPVQTQPPQRIGLVDYGSSDDSE